MTIHTLNKTKIEDSLIKRGWLKGIHGEWIAPLGKGDPKSFEKDWTEAVLEGIECSLEQSKKETKDFLQKHPTRKR